MTATAAFPASGKRVHARAGESSEGFMAYSYDFLNEGMIYVMIIMRLTDHSFEAEREEHYARI